MIDNTKKLEDKYYMAYFLFYVLGTLSLVPANFFTTATDYWMYKFRDTQTENFSSKNRTKLQADFTSSYSIVSHVSSVVFLVLTIIVLMKRLSIVQRIIGALCGVLIMFGLTVIFVEINTDTWQKGFFVITLISGCFLTAFCSVFLVSLFQLVSKFPPGYLVAILSGQSICGIAAALIQIFSLSIGASSKTNGLIYFLIGMFFVFIALVYFLITLKKSQFFIHYHTIEMQTKKPKITKTILITILNKLKLYICSMIIVLGCSVMINPAVTSLVLSMDKGNRTKWNDIFFVPVSTFLCYNVFDYIGKEIAAKLRRPRNGVIILIMSIFRIALIPMIMLCNAQPRTHLPVIFKKDYVYTIFIIIFAFTNGFLVNLCVIRVPIVTTLDEKPIATVLILIFMVITLGMCSFISAGLINAL